MSSQLRWIFALFQVVLHSFVTTVTVPEHTVVVPKPVCSYQNYITFQRHLQCFRQFCIRPAFFSYLKVYFHGTHSSERPGPGAPLRRLLCPDALLRVGDSLMEVLMVALEWWVVSDFWRMFLKRLMWFWATDDLDGFLSIPLSSWSLLLSFCWNFTGSDFEAWSEKWMCFVRYEAIVPLENRLDGIL